MTSARIPLFLLPPWMGNQSIAGLPTTLNYGVPSLTQEHCKTMSMPELEPQLLNPEVSALTMKPQENEQEEDEDVDEHEDKDRIRIREGNEHKDENG